MTDLFEQCRALPPAEKTKLQEFQRELVLDVQRQNQNSLQELRLEEDITAITQTEKQQILGQLRDVGNLTVAQLEFLLSKAGNLPDAQVLAVIRTLLEAKRIQSSDLSAHVAQALEAIDVEHPAPSDVELIKQLFVRFPRGIRTLQLTK